MKHNDVKTIGSRIRELRKKMGYSQEELAEIMHTTKGTICKYENDMIDLKISALKELAKNLHTTVTYLVEGSDKNVLSEEEIDILTLFSAIGEDRLRELAMQQLKSIS